MSGSDAVESLGLGFGHGAEAVTPERALLLEVVSDRREAVVGERFGNKGENGVRFTFSEDASEKNGVKFTFGEDVSEPDPVLRFNAAVLQFLDGSD
jgi:hypothetical protein